MFAKTILFLPRLIRISIFLLLPALLIIVTIPVCAQTPTPPLVRTPTGIVAWRQLPPSVLKPGQAIPVNFSTDPADEEIYRVHFFEEPLVPTNEIALPGENTALVMALAAFSQRKTADDFSSLITFLNNYPKSRWRGALLTSLGIVYRRTGYFNQALAAWEEAWSLLKKQNDSRLLALAGRTASEILLLYAWTGRAEKIDSLLKVLDQFTLTGPADERVVSIRHGLWEMKNNPGISFKCGPFALEKLRRLYDSTQMFNEKLSQVASTPKGFSLTELQHMANDIGLRYQMAFRQPGASVIANAVVHWKLDHYSALVNTADGHIACEDVTMGTTYGFQFYLTAAALDSSASGYFLVPDGSLPTGWRSVSEQEGCNIFGKGQVPPDNGQHVSDDDPQVPEQCSAKPMAQCNVHAGPVSLHIYDRPVYYTPPKGPAIFWNVDYHQRDSYQPANFNYSNMGPKWTFEWLSYLQDNPNSPSANVSIYLMGGGDRTFTGYNSATSSYAPELQSNDVLVRICATCYEVRHPDGSKDVYARPDGNTSAGRKIFLTQKIDAAGNAVTLNYDASLRLVALQDASGQVTTLSYNNTDSYKITKVTDPFGRYATFDYDATGKLSKITDMIGIVSSFHYATGDFIDQMTTPYGNTSFIKVEGPGSFRSLEIHYPQSEKERIEFRENAPGINFSESIYPTGMNLFNSYVTYRNTFYWDKKAMQDAPGDYSKARLYHWVHGSDATGENGSAGPILESIKNPLENRIWFNYQGQTNGGFANQGMSAWPSKIGRVLSDGTTQTNQNRYNVLGALTSTIDATGRKITYTYDSTNINLLEARQTTGSSNELLAKYTYNSKYLPVTAQDASGQITKYTYNNTGQLISIQNPKNETTTYQYDGNGFLTNITGPVAGTTLQFTYDGFGRVRTVTDAEGYTTSTDYDALDRPTVITYPDNTYEQIVYDRLDAVQHRDRLGRWTYTTYDSLDRPIAIKDALGRITQYVWCTCGSLSKIIDPQNHTTTFTRDVQGRLTAKTYHDGKSITYKYDGTTSRLQEASDAKGQKMQYSYYIDENLKQVTYANATIATAPVTFTYDTKYNRIATMTDGSGTTQYSYNPVTGVAGLGAGRLAAVDGPLNNDVISYGYDSLGRLTSRAINGIPSNIAFDVLGRTQSVTNVLGKFDYTYAGQTPRPASMHYPNGQNSTYSYYDNAGDQRLKQILNTTTSGGLISAFEYTYNAAGQINQWTQFINNTQPKYYTLGYDAVDQLTTVTQKIRNSPLAINSFAYQYDGAGNRILEQASNKTTVSEYNALNQLTRQWRGDTLYNKGSVPNVGVASFNNTITYDNNGNTLSASLPGVTYDWDAVDRLVKITKGNTITEFVYDGLSRRVAEKLNGTIIRRWLWDGMDLREERDATGATITKRFFNQGEQINGINYYFTKDHLGSIREVTDTNGVVRTRYDYDPYGRRIKLSGNLDADFGFTGRYYHATSGLHLALYRSYDAELGRWVNRDPIGEDGGLNLFARVNNNPVNKIDFLGLKMYPADFIGPITPQDCLSDIPTHKEEFDVDKNIEEAKNKSPLWFYYKVKGHGDWDYKQQGRQYQNFGNFNFGATGAANGFSDKILLTGAGLAQTQAGTSTPEWGSPFGGPPYGDDPEDQYWIKKGIEYYRNGPKNNSPCCEK